MDAKVVVMAHNVKGFASRCPVIDAWEMADYFRIFRFWEKGQYPNSGTWADQPNKLVMMMEVINEQSTSQDTDNG